MKEKFIAELKRSTKASHTIRVLAGGYLLYIVYQLFSEIGKGENDIIIILFTVFFAIVGVLLAGSSLYALSKYYYAENKTLDPDYKEEESDDEQDSAESDDPQ